MKNSHVILSIIIFATLFVVSCGKDNETTYANLQGEWYANHCDKTIIFTSDTTLTIILESVDEEQKCKYRLQPEGIMYITYAGTTTEHTVKFINNRKIIISGMTIMYEVLDTGEVVFKKKIF